MHQTLSLTTLGELEPVLAGQPRAAAARRPTGSAGTSSRATSTGPRTVAEISDDGFAKRLRIELPDELLPYVVEHGSIAIEGVSLTVADLDRRRPSRSR